MGGLGARRFRLPGRPAAGYPPRRRLQIPPPAPPAPRAVVFDLGNVLLDFDYGRAARALAPRAEKSAAEIRALIDHSPLLSRYETGRLSPGEFYAEFCQRAGYRGGAARAAAD